ncbi:hypothetical protein [Priestia megaterium]|uniref:Uncharacterized protein n=1 Tax=Priestia megaterium TaxID=1404 RepID=A0A6M6E9S6_PRIMG|nr:hypothetical protein [Priestia megaterium]QJX80335.1 hypothetical protein FDZ14_30055 [Priestia megaterium]
MSRDKELIFENTKPTYLKFYVYKKKSGTTASAYFSDGLLNLIKERNFISLEMGFNKTTHTVFLKFHNNDDAISLITSQGNYKRSITVNAQLKKLLIDNEVNLADSFTLREIENNLFSLGKEVSYDENIKKEAKLIEWFGVNGQTQGKKPQGELWVKFYNFGPRITTMRISKELKILAQQYRMTHIKLGFSKNSHSLFIKLNNEGQGASILNKFNEYKEKSIFIQMDAAYLKNSGVYIKPTSIYFLQLKDNFTFQLSLSEKNKLDTGEIHWGPNKARKEDLWIKYYTHKSVEQGLFVSNGLLNLAQQNKMTFMQYGFIKETGSTFIRLNNKGNGLPLINQHNEYKYNKEISASKIIYYLNSVDIYVNFKEPYYLIEYLEEKDSWVFEILSPIRSSSYAEPIHWISNEELRLIYREREVKRKSISKSEGDKETYSIDEPELYAEASDFPDEELDIEENNDEDFDIEEINEERKKMSSFVKFSENDPFAHSLSLSKKLLRFCTEQGATHLQIESHLENNAKEVYLKLNSSGKGASLINSDYTYKKSIDVTNIFKTINKEEENLKSTAWYSGERIEDSVFKITAQFWY